MTYLSTLEEDRPDGGKENQAVEIGAQCRLDSGVNIANRVLIQIQTVLILELPLSKTFTYSNLLPMIAQNDKVDLFFSCC